MADDATLITVCPWCSEPLPAPGAVDCPTCGAHLVEDTSVELPGVTAVDPGLLRAAAAPRKVKRTFGSLLVGDDDEIPPPTEAEMPALARPDAEVRREMLRLELEARLASLQAEARMLDADDRPESLAGEQARAIEPADAPASPTGPDDAPAEPAAAGDAPAAPAAADDPPAEPAGSAPADDAPVP